METKAHAVEATLAAATRIGETLCATAYWDERRRDCAWMGYADAGSPAQGNETTAFAAVDANLYAGTAGVALFLAELYALTRNSLFGDTSLGALRRSISLLKPQNAQAAPLSLFSGHLGAAYVTSRLNDIGLGEDLEGELEKTSKASGIGWSSVRSKRSTSRTCSTSSAGAPEPVPSCLRSRSGKVLSVA
jgi:lantibiotic modifying enzyme